jgi:hypothetical protein
LLACLLALFVWTVISRDDLSDEHDRCEPRIGLQVGACTERDQLACSQEGEEDSGYRRDQAQDPWEAGIRLGGYRCGHEGSSSRYMRPTTTGPTSIPSYSSRGYSDTCVNKSVVVLVDGGPWYPWPLDRMGFEWEHVTFGYRNAI